MRILQEEHALLEIVKLIGADSLAESQKKILTIAKTIRERFLQQNAYDEKDTYMSLQLQFELIENILYSLLG